MDMCGAMERPFLSGNRYCVTFISGARISFIYFLKGKKDVFVTFKEKPRLGRN